MKAVILLLIHALALVPILCANAQVAITLDGQDTGRVFEGIGAVSAGASTRLLPDYPEPQRSEVLDYLFKPKFGAGFQHLKVEIGGGENSTCGSEPSHVLTREELAHPRGRGYEFWFMAEARKRNPKIILDCLPWTYPRWISDRFSQDSADWFAAFLEVARQQYGLELDWVSAAQNENGTDGNWIKNQLRPTLDRHGFKRVKLQAPDDDSEYWEFFDVLEKDPELNRIVQAVGYHYVDGREPWEIDQVAKRDATLKAKASCKPLWASEEWSQSGGQWGAKGALYVARLMNKLYTRDRITKFEIWCPIDSIYDSIIWGDTGAMQADQPWSGHYVVWPAVWAIAHTTQFAEPGWRYLDSACGQFAPKTWRGSYVALRQPDTGDWSLIIVTDDAADVVVRVKEGLKTGPIHLWRSSEQEQFVQQPLLALDHGQLRLHLDGDSIYSLTTTTGQQKGHHATPPPSRPFPFPYTEDFDQYQVGDTPRYFSDQKGTFEVAARPEGGLCLAQITPREGILWYGNKLLKPHSLFGDKRWQDYTIAAQVKIAGGDVEIGGRYAGRDKLGYRWAVAQDGSWRLNWQDKTLASGKIDSFDASQWHQLRLVMKGSTIRGLLDNKELTSVQNNAQSAGMAFIASTYDHNLFDHIHVAKAVEQPGTN